MKKIFIISLGGSLFFSKKHNFFKLNEKFLKNFKNFILKFLRKKFTFIIIVGGGLLAKEYIKKAKNINDFLTDSELDNLGIKVTEINAFLLKNIFGKSSYYKILNNPETKIKFSDFENKVLFVYGFKTGHSTDYVSVLWAKKFNLDSIINLSDIDYIYDKNPKKFKTAKKIKEIEFTQYLKNISSLKTWQPKLSLPFDPLATELAFKYKIKIFTLNGKKLKNLENFLLGKKFKGTKIY